MEDDVIDWAFYNAEEKRYLIAQCVREMGGPNTLQWDENRPRGIPSYRSIMRHLNASTWPSSAITEQKKPRLITGVLYCLAISLIFRSSSPHDPAAENNAHDTHEDVRIAYVHLID